MEVRVCHTYRVIFLTCSFQAVFRESFVILAFVLWSEGIMQIPQHVSVQLWGEISHGSETSLKAER
jgi:hypothetical protein